MSDSVPVQGEALAHIATGAPLSLVFESIVRMVEAQLPGALCSILLLDGGGRLHAGVAPSLPEVYSRTVEGLAIGPEVGTCGRAAFLGQPVLTEDIASDPRWSRFLDMAQQCGLASCWSVPILGNGSGPPRSRVLGTFALYRRESGPPPPRATEVLSTAAQLAGVAIAREAALAAVRESEERYRTLLENSTEALFLEDEDGTVLDVNPQAERSLGHRRDELVGNLPSFFDPGFAAQPSRCGVDRLAPGEVATFESHHRRKDGTLFPVEIRVRRFQLLGRTVKLAAVRDLTERRRLESRMLEVQKLEAIGHLAGGVAHDFNNLLTVIASSCEFAIEATAPSDPRREDLLLIREAGSRAARLTQQLLAFSRRAVVEPRLLDADEVVRSLRAVLASLMGESVSLRLELATQKEPVRAVRIDRGQLEQVLINLAINARDAMPRGGACTIASSLVESQRADGTPALHVCLRVSDTGVGMSEEVKARAFEPFFTTKPTGQGTGLGLATVFGVITQAEGHIELDSSPGRGTTFRLFLPMATGVVPRPSPHAPDEPLGGSETILIAEDESALRMLAARVLTRHGYHTIAAPSGEAALEAAVAHPGPIHLLLTDVIMPGMGGRELAESLCALRPELRVLYMSGYTDDAALLQGRSEGGDTWLHKPFLPSALARRVRAILDAPQ